MKPQIALALLLAVCCVSVNAQQSSGSSAAGGSSSGASPSAWSGSSSGQSKSGQASNQPTQTPEKVAYAKCCVPPGGDGTTSKPYSSYDEANADKTWNKLQVMPSKADMDKMGGDTLSQEMNPDGSLNTTNAPTPTPPPRSTATVKGRVIETIGTDNIFNCQCAAPTAPGSNTTGQ